MKYWKLPKEFTQKWLEALRSGEYRQGEGMLKDFLEDDSTVENYFYCCLGVAAELCDDIYISTGRDQMPGENSSILDSKTYPLELKVKTASDHSDKNYLDSVVDVLVKLNDGLNGQEYIKMIEKAPNLIFSRHPNKISEEVRYNFEEIAEFIEKNCELV